MNNNIKNKYHSDAVKRINKFKILYNAYLQMYITQCSILKAYYDKNEDIPFNKNVFIIHTDLAKTYKNKIKFFSEWLKENKNTAKHFNRKYNKKHNKQ